MRQRQRGAGQAAPAQTEEDVEVIDEEIPGEETETEVTEGEDEESAEDGAGAEQEAPADEGEDPYEVLQRNYQAALKEKEDAERRWQETEARRQDLDRRRAELEARDAERATTEIANHKALIEHALMAADGEATNAEAAYAAAMAEGDYAAAAKAQRAMAKAEMKISRLTEGRDAIEEQIKTPPQRQAEPQRPAAPDPIDQTIAGFTPRSQTWLRSHKSDIFGSNARRQMAIAGDMLAQESGLKADTDEYFEFLDKHMGYQTAAPITSPAPETPPRPRTPARPSAPVSRTAAGTAKAPVHLTAEQKDTAARLGMTNAKYADYIRRIDAGEFNVRFTPEGVGR